ncbi:MAG: ABC transporter ATP-binding protein [Acidimicrobiaceae bacterium]|nr:ABC transporter ATP-binding protein [Acidimicrobiaceae bacterium]
MGSATAPGATATTGPALLDVTDLVKHYRIRSGGSMAHSGPPLRAVDGVSFRVAAGETLGLVGESGGGKTTVGLSVLRLIRPSGGSVTFEGRDVLAAGRTEMKALRQRMQIVFQDPIGALDPRKSVGDSVAEGLRIQGLAFRSQSHQRAVEVLDRVGLTAAQSRSLPHELSGGQLQRVGIARALALDPRLVVCDEPVSALDVSIQAQIINLLLDLQAERGLAYLFIAHDLALVRHISDRVAVMYLGRIVESAPAGELFDDPAHPYTRALLSAVPADHPAAAERRIVLRGEIPSAAGPPRGCPFAPRCPDAMAKCSEETPEFKQIAPGRWAACFLND